MGSQRGVPVKGLVPAFICRHCGEAGYYYARGLCWTCYYSPGVLAMYPLPDGVRHRLGVIDYNGHSREGQPTGHLPGSADKIAVLEERARNGQALFHRWDAETPL